MLATKLMCGTVVKIGDVVSFKSDIEQCGKITKIAKNAWGGSAILTLQSTRDEGFAGDYISGAEFTQQAAEDCWVE